jgi:hypothetical protein
MELSLFSFILPDRVLVVKRFCFPESGKKALPIVQKGLSGVFQYLTAFRES